MAYCFKRLMWWLGYRRVLYTPASHGLPMADFWAWKYAPDAEKRDYTERDLPL